MKRRITFLLISKYRERNCKATTIRNIIGAAIDLSTLAVDSSIFVAAVFMVRIALFCFAYFGFLDPCPRRLCNQYELGFSSFLIFLFSLFSWFFVFSFFGPCFSSSFFLAVRGVKERKKKKGKRWTKLNLFKNRLDVEYAQLIPMTISFFTNIINLYN